MRGSRGSLTRTTTERPDPVTVLAWGETVLKKVRKEAPKSKQLPSEILWPHIEKAFTNGWNQQEIATGLHLSERRIRQLKAKYAHTTFHIPNVRDLTKVHPRMARFTVEAFVEFFERYNLDDYKVPPHVRSWLQAFIDHRHLLLNVPPRHSKSHYFSLWIPIWLICRDRNVQIILVSETKEFARGWASEIAGQLESNQRLLEDLGHFAPERKGDFAWRPEGGSFAVRGRTRHARGAQLTIQSRGMEQQILGMEADYVILDDPTNAEKAKSETEHKAEMSHLREQVFTRIQGFDKATGSGARAIVVGQRVHAKDMYGDLARQVYEQGPKKGLPFWHHENHPAIKTEAWQAKEPEQIEVLWPDFWSFDELMIKYELVGGYDAFECIFQQNPSPEASAIIKPEWYHACKDHSRGGYQGIKEDVTGVSRVLSIDPSPNNFHGIIVGDLLWSRDQFYLVLLEMKHFRGGLRDLIEDVRRVAESYDIDYLVFEQSTFAKWFFEDPFFQEAKQRFHVIKHKTNINKNDAEYGVQSLASDFEFNRISLPYGDLDGQKMTDLLAKEALPYPNGDYDDILMALWFCKYNFKRLRPLDQPVFHTPKGEGWAWMEQMKKKVANVG